MKLSLTFLLTALVALATADNQATCEKKNHNLVIAIKKFCSKTNLVTPSPYSTKGMDSPDHHSHVSIEGMCSPAAWVPQEYCLGQFYWMCAHGGAHGARTALYGQNQCQDWKITYKKHV